VVGQFRTDTNPQFLVNTSSYREVFSYPRLRSGIFMFMFIDGLRTRHNSFSKLYLLSEVC